MAKIESLAAPCVFQCAVVTLVGVLLSQATSVPHQSVTDLTPFASPSA
jgi:hypothetical protein